MPDIFEPRKNYKPFEYDEITKPFIEAIWASHWTHKEFSFKSDVQDFRTQLTDEEREVIKRAVLLISQVEVSVKSYWSNIGKILPKPEIGDVGAVFGGNEVVHSRAYSEILSKLGLNEDFQNMLSSGVVNNRVNYLSKYVNKIYKNDYKNIVYSLILFTLFTENVSLFSQFFILLGFNRYNNVLKDVANVVQYTSKEEECFIEGTEVLTPTGWKDLMSMKVGDKVYQFNEGFLEETFVLNTVQKNIKAPLIKFHNNNSECIVTENHDMIYYTFNRNGSHGKEILKRKAKDFSENPRFVVPLSSPLRGRCYRSFSDMDRLKIAIQADGTFKYFDNGNGRKPRGGDRGQEYSIALKKERKKERLRNILNNLEIEWREVPVSNKKGYSCFTLYTDEDYNYKTFDWIELDKVDTEWCQEFISEIKHWDGFDNGYAISNYSSTDKECIDISQILGILAGYKTNIQKRVDNRSEKFSDSYKISFREIPDNKVYTGMNKKVIDYEGKVGCITVNSGVIMTRYNDKTFISGNCHSKFGIALINKIKEERPEIFDEELIDRIIEESQEAIKAEEELIDWMLQGFENEFLSKDILLTFVKKRINDALAEIGVKHSFDTKKSLVDKSSWMEEEIYADSITDFFIKRPIDYAKKNKSFSEEDLF